MRKRAGDFYDHFRSLVLQGKPAVYAFWGLLFTLAYSQAPLFTSNQNQYFLHGYARANYGFLAGDWLANTVDPAPVFSAIVFVLFTLLRHSEVFYAVFGLLAAGVLFSLAAISRQVWHIPRTRQADFLLYTLLIAINSSAVRYLFLRAGGPDWNFLPDGGVANQRLLGAVLQPSAFGVLLLISISCFLGKRIRRAVVLLVLAAVIHPTYLLTAGVLTLIYAGLMFAETRSIKGALLIGAGALAGVLPVLVNTLRIFVSSDRLANAQAHKILVLKRIPHHALISHWMNATVPVKLAIVLAAVLLLVVNSRKHGFSFKEPAGKLLVILTGLLLSAVCLTAVVYFTESVSLSLIFPWRISTVLVPVSMTVIAGAGLVKALDKASDWLAAHRRLVFRAGLLCVALLAGAGLAKSVMNARQKYQAPEYRIYAYLRAAELPAQQVLTPLKMQDFRLATGLPQYVDFKSIPYKDDEVIEWYRRYRFAQAFYQTPKKNKACPMLDDFAREGITMAILPKGSPAAGCPQLNLIYQDEDYAIGALRGK